MNRTGVVGVVLALSLAGSAIAAAAGGTSGTGAAQASIPFVNSGSSIRDWRADDVHGLWVQDAHRQWYCARLMSYCDGLDFALRIGFETRGVDTLDRFATVVVPGHGRCAIQSFTKSAAPAGDDEPRGKDSDAG